MVINDYLLDLTKKIDIGIVDGEVNKNSSCASVDPEIIEKILNERFRYGFILRQVEYESTAAVVVHETLIARTI